MSKKFIQLKSGAFVNIDKIDCFGASGSYYSVMIAFEEENSPITKEVFEELKKMSILNEEKDEN